MDEKQKQYISEMIQMFESLTESARNTNTIKPPEHWVGLFAGIGVTLRFISACFKTNDIDTIYKARHYDEEIAKGMAELSQKVEDSGEKPEVVLLKAAAICFRLSEENRIPKHKQLLN